MCHRVTSQLHCQPDSVTAGRHFTADALAAWGVGPGGRHARVRQDILLVTTELLSNAVKAASEPILLSVEAHHNRVDISVADDSPNPAIRRPAGIDRPGGHGLLLVDTLAERWGQRRLDDRTKEVWAQVAIPARAPLTVDCRHPRL